LKYEDNEDEIIRIATEYMLGNAKRKGRPKRQAKEKPQKKFFLPDNAQTDFRTARSLLNQDTNDNGKPQTQDDTNEKFTQSSNYSEERSVLDSILDSDDENDVSTTNVLENSVLKENDEPKMTTPTSQAHQKAQDEVKTNENNNKPKKTLGLKRPRLNHSDVITQNQAVVPEPKSESTSKPSQLRIKSTSSTSSATTSSTISQTTRKKTLGLKKQRIATGGITDLLRSCQQKTINNDPNDIITIDDDDILELPSYTPMKTEQTKENDIVKTSLDSPGQEEDIFDDGLDEELAFISSVSLPSVYDQDFTSSQIYKSRESEEPQSPHIVKQEVQNEDKKEEEELFSDGGDNVDVYKDTFEPSDGVLNANEKMELYTSYYTTLDPSERISVYDPVDCIVGGCTAKGNIDHSRKSNVVLNHARQTKDLTEKKAREILAQYKAHKHKEYSLSTIVISDSDVEEEGSLGI
jgi:ATP-dependent DNA helicase MPH1